ncbi:Spore germination protein gerPA/gerPF [Caldalkalibacillus thermarum TA2.A1]|uniref:Spore germination protein gerPA/gerPF n=1 Tax=Caldalkalibacillus thermarum (strain TA2.A1) TaxID=986075 RepID=F5L7D3_CALTT|nr:Spore germination protein gerPA/gerPF [Caldalkalibacillus thermarum TA2.A1]
MIPVTHINNIFGIRINNVSSNGSVNFGNVIHKGHSANSKSVGGQTVIGDAVNGPATNFDKNLVKDPDLIDQPQKQL